MRTPAANRSTRARIAALVDAAAAWPVTLLAAPGGYGKSFAVRGRLDTSGRLHAATRLRAPVRSLSSYARELSLSLRPIAPGLAPSFAPANERALRSANAAYALADWVAHHLSGLRCTIFLDDLQKIEDPTLSPFLARLVNRAPAGVRFVIASRSIDNLPFAGWMATEKLGCPIEQHQLALSPEEAHLLGAPLNLDIHAIEALRMWTRGMPEAFLLAATLAGGGGARADELVRRPFNYDSLAAAVTASLPPGQQEALRSTCVFAEIRPEYAAALTRSVPIADALRRSLNLPGTVCDEATVRLSERFRSASLRALMPDTTGFISRCTSAAQICESAGALLDAIALYSAAGRVDALERLITGHGFALVDDGRHAELRHALDALPAGLREGNAELLAVASAVAAHGGTSAGADAGYLAAIARASEEQRVAFSLRLARERFRRGTTDVAELLAAFGNDEDLAAPVRAEIASLLAVSFATAGDKGDAFANISRALSAAALVENVEARAETIHRCAWAALRLNEPLTAKNLSREAVALAESHGASDLVARTAALLCDLSYRADDDAAATLSLAQRVAASAAAAGNAELRHWALASIYALEVERGKAGILSVRDELPARASFTAAPDALRAAWSGDFAHAYRLMTADTLAPGTPERCAVVAAQAALYAAASGQRSESEASIATALDNVKRSASDGIHRRTAILWVALTHMVLGDWEIADVLLSGIGDCAPGARSATFARALRVVYDAWSAQRGVRAIEPALEDLAAHDLAGLARLIGALPITRYFVTVSAAFQMTEAS